jgi:ABC-2 type transport system permease protein
MSLLRIRVLFGKELKYAFKSYFFIFAVIAPIALTLMVNLLFGSLFSGKPKLGIFDPGNSQFIESFSKLETFDLQLFYSEKELKNAVATGVLDMGILLSTGFDSIIQSGEKIQLSTYVWGQSLLKDRALIRSGFLYQAREKSNQEAPIEIVMVSLGDEENVPWKDRFLPIIILMAIFISGFTIPAASLVEEKQRKTIGPILTTPVTQSEIFISKSAIGILISILMGTFTLYLNNAISTQFALTLFVLFLGAIMASCFGLLLGAFMSDMAALYSAIKGLGIVLYGPGIVVMFPQIPQWIGKIFPTYYIMNPILEINQRGGNWTSIKLDILILVGILMFLVALVGVVANMTKQQGE